MTPDTRTSTRRALTAAAALCLLLGASACEDKKTEEAKKPAGDEPAAETTAPPETTPPPETSAGEGAEPATEEPPGTEPAAAGEYLRVVVEHHDPAQGPVEATFSGFQLVAANVDLDNPGASWAEYKVDPSTFASGNNQRDEHVKSPDFLNVPGFADVTFRVHQLAAVEGAADTYKAVATLTLLGVQKDVPVEFKVVDKAADGTVTVEGSGTLKRSDFSLGKAPAEANVADDIKVDARLKLKDTDG